MKIAAVTSKMISKIKLISFWPLKTLSFIVPASFPHAIMLPAKDIQIIAKKILPKSNSRLWHEALMDFGASICIKRNPKCSECPLFDNCKSGTTLIHRIKDVKPLRVNTEAHFFGYPKRIWRGKVLKLISTNGTIIESKIVKSLIPIKKEDPSAFSQLIKNILNDLVHEGFCRSVKKGVYTLA